MSPDMELNHEDQVAKEIRALGPHIHSPVPNPSPIGLFAFGLTTALLQMKHTHLAGSAEHETVGVENLTWGFAMFYGGLLQIIAGLGEVKRNNLFGYTAFLSYGGFWMSIGTAEIATKVFTLLGEVSSDGVEVGINSKAVQAMMVMMGIFTAILWVCTFTTNKCLCLLIFSLMMTFFLLAVGVDHKHVDVAAGWVGIFTAAVAFFLAGAELINDIIGGGNELIPLGHFDSNKFKFAGYFHVPGRIHGVTETAVLRNSEFGPDEKNATTISCRNVDQESMMLASPTSNSNVHDESHLNAHRVGMNVSPK
jgi:succinate-acetate transporter protein